MTSLGDVNNQVYVSLNIVMTVLGSSASLTIILLIHRMHRDSPVITGHVLLILIMSYFQLLYDITFFFSNVDCGYYISLGANLIQLSCGIAGSLVSNWIAFVAWYVVTFRKKFDIVPNIYLILISSFLPGLCDAVVYAVAMIPQNETNDDLANISVLGIYYYTRLASIGINFLLCGVTIYKTKLMGMNSGTRSVQELAIRTVTYRLIYYPIVQAIGRSGYSWYEAQYGDDIDSGTEDPGRFGCLIFLTIITPMVSVGYLVIFLAMQPNAYKYLKAGLQCREMDADTDAASGTRSMVSTATTATTEEAYDMFTNEADRSMAARDRGRTSQADWARPSSFAGAVFGAAALDSREDEELLSIATGSTGTSTQVPFRASAIQMQSGVPSERSSSQEVIMNTLHNAGLSVV